MGSYERTPLGSSHRVPINPQPLKRKPAGPRPKVALEVLLLMSDPGKEAKTLRAVPPANRIEVPEERRE
jgi:hypothetical protein